MSLTHQLLYERRDFAQLDLADYLQRLAQANRVGYRPAQGRIALRLELPVDGMSLDLERSIPCGLLVNELLTNAFKHAFPAGREGEIVIELREDGDGTICLSIADDGVGLPSDLDLEKSSSLGLQLVPLFVEQLHGVMEIERVNGSRFSIRFPRSFDGGEDS
jgi:two-component sensor histidine kinase